ncbi:unnamed protein product, partial [Mesorhabditis spiculigera]
MSKDGYLREIMNRYESEEDEFMRELEQMSHSIREDEASILSKRKRNSVLCERDDSESDVPQDPQPILSVLCSLVDEIGTLRKENRRLKTRLALPPPRMNVMQRMSTLLDSRGISIPKLRRQPEVRIGARERLSTPPKKDPLTASSISTDFSASSRDPSEAMTSSRSSFFEFIGLKKRKEVISSVSDLLHPPRVVTRRKRKDSRDADEIAREERQRRLKNRQSARFAAEESEEDTNSMANKRKSTSYLTTGYDKDRFENENVLRVDRETRLRHERDSLSAEIAELKTRNERLVEQLREKSGLFSRQQDRLAESEQECDVLRRKCHFNESLDRLSLRERFTHSQMGLFGKVEDRLREFESNLQQSRAEIASQDQMAKRAVVSDQAAYRSMVEQVERVQRENLRLTQKCLKDAHIEDGALARKLSLLPSYDALYAFSMGMVKKLGELRSALHDKSGELSRAELDLIAAQSSLLITHTQLHLCGRTIRRAASFHGDDLVERNAKRELHFLLPFKLQGSRLENLRRQNRKQAQSAPTFESERALEHEFLNLFGYAQSLAHIADRPDPSPKSRDHGTAVVTRHDTACREHPQPPCLRQRQRAHERLSQREREGQRRPISLVELEERRQRIVDEQRRSILVKAPEKRQEAVLSLQDVSSPPRSPLATPLSIRRRTLVNSGRPPDSPIIGERKERRLEKQRSIDVEVLRRSELRQQSTEKPPDPRPINERKPERKIERVPSDRAPNPTQNKDDLKDDALVAYRPSSRLQRSAPVSRIRPPHATFRPKAPDSAFHATGMPTPRPKARTLEYPSALRHPSPPCAPVIPAHLSGSLSPTQSASRLPKPEKRSWIERLKQMKK